MWVWRGLLNLSIVGLIHGSKIKPKIVSGWPRLKFEKTKKIALAIPLKLPLVVDVERHVIRSLVQTQRRVLASLVWALNLLNEHRRLMWTAEVFMALQGPYLHK